MPTVMNASQNAVVSRNKVRDEPHVTEALSKSMNGWLQHHMREWTMVWTACVRRTHRWRVPPRWSLSDWWEEIDAESIAAACHAIRIFDPNLGPTLNSFVYHTILASALRAIAKSGRTRCVTAWPDPMTPSPSPERRIASRSSRRKSCSSDP